MSSAWFAADVTCAAAAADAVASALDIGGAEGTAIDSLRCRPNEPVLVTGFFKDPISIEAVRAAIEPGLSVYGLGAASVDGVALRDVEDADWLAEWKKHWRPTEIGKFIIAPPWSDVLETDKNVIRIEPNMAFGTGTHDTTQLCLKAIGELYDPSMSLLDVGTGTGVLAIAAAKLGGSEILACDIDHDSVGIARENALMNEVAAQVTFFEGRVTADTPQHGFVCANLTLDVILPTLDLLLAKTEKVLLLSGILAEQQNEITTALSKFGVESPRIARSGEWISAVVTR